jgi:chemotaxis protein CheD
VAEKLVRMAEQAVGRSGDVLVTIGLGSCIGLALLDPARPVAGLAHVVLPESSGETDGAGPAKFADKAVPSLLRELERAGAVARRLDAVLVGGAQMFAFSRRDGAGMDVGARNEAAVVAALRRAGIPVRALATGGTKGRTIRVQVENSTVTVKEAGGSEVELWSSEGLVLR